MAALSAEIAFNGRLSAEIESCIYEISLDIIIHVFLNFRRVLCSTSPHRAWDSIYLVLAEGAVVNQKSKQL